MTAKRRHTEVGRDRLVESVRRESRPGEGVSPIPANSSPAAVFAWCLRSVVAVERKAIMDVFPDPVMNLSAQP